MQIRLGLFLAAAIAAPAIAAGCSGGSKDMAVPSPSPSPSPTATVTPPPGAVVEVEPNDVEVGDDPTPFLAGPGTQTFFGVCADDNDFDYYIFTAGSGMVAAQITWVESAANDDLDLYVSSTSFAISQGDDSIPPGDSPAMVSLLTTNAGLQFFVQVDCYNSSPNVAYSGLLTIP